MLDSQASGPVPVLSGVPPRTGLMSGPFFLIFINDLPENIRSSVRRFADDCVLYRNIKIHYEGSFRIVNSYTRGRNFNQGRGFAGSLVEFPSPMVRFP